LNNIAQLESIAECECEKHRIAAIFVVEDTGLETECHSAKVFHRKGCFTCMVGLMQRTVGIGCYLKDTRESTSWELYSVYLKLLVVPLAAYAVVRTTMLLVVRENMVQSVQVAVSQPEGKSEG
jgi:hypothetical protein